jgi:hypothetical protein
MRIKIEKIASSEGGIPAIPADQHVAGTYQGENYSLPISYWIEGDLIFPISGKIEVGGSVCIRRHVRNGIPVEGYMETTKVIEVTENTFKTKNSVYRYQIYE